MTSDRSPKPATISLLHATRKRVERALMCKKRWMDAAALPERVEHLFAVDPDDSESVEKMAGHVVLMVQDEGKGCVGAWNLAAERSRGEILVQLSDDWVPSKGWDLEFERRLIDVTKPAVLRVSDGHRMDDLLCMAIFTRAWYQKMGWFLSPEYFGVYSDDEFSYRAYEAGVVIDARDLILEHEHPSFDTAVEEDETYRRQNSSANYQKGREVFLRRNPEALTRWLHEGTSLRYFLPPGHEALEKGRVLMIADAGVKNPVSGEWRSFSKRANELLVEKKAHLKTFRATMTTIVRAGVEVTRSLPGRLAVSSAGRKTASDLLKAAEGLKVKEVDVVKGVEESLKIAKDGLRFLEQMSKRSWIRGSISKGLVADLRAQVDAQAEWWKAVGSVVETLPEGADRKLPEAYRAPVVKGGIPVYIISFNQMTHVRNMVEQLLNLDVRPSEIHVVDNQSTFPPLLDYLREIEGQGIHVHRMPRNLGPRGIFEPEAGLNLPEVFAVTDPDLQFHAAMPKTFREDMLQVAAWCGVWKCGCALNISERADFLTGDYSGGKSIAEWEKQFWVDPVPGWPPALSGRSVEARGSIFRAGVDTTFAVYVRDRVHGSFMDAVRVAECFEARHLPWYACNETLLESVNSEPCLLRDGRPMVRPLPAEVSWYRQRENSSTTSKMGDGVIEKTTFATDPESSYPLVFPTTGNPEDSWQHDWTAGDCRELVAYLREITVTAGRPLKLLSLSVSKPGLCVWSGLRFQQVVCFEPDSVVRASLRDAVAVNRLEHRISVLSLPVADSGGITRLMEMVGVAADGAAWVLMVGGESIASEVVDYWKQHSNAFHSLIMEVGLDAENEWTAKTGSGDWKSLSAGGRHWMCIHSEASQSKGSEP